MPIRKYKPHPGQIIIVALIFLTMVLILSGTLFGRTATFLRFGATGIREEQAINMAEAGVDYAIKQLNDLPSWTGAGETVLPTGSFEVTVQEKNPPDPVKKTLISTGYTPNKASARSKKTVKLDIEVSTTGPIEFGYAAQVGTTGISMSGGTINGNVHTNGSITGTGTITNNASAVVGIDATITAGSKTTPTGVQPLPTFPYDFWRTEANQGDAPGDCDTLAGHCTVCPCTIAAGTIGPMKYQGDVTISNNVSVIMNGPIYITGNLLMRNGNTELKLADSFGNNSGVLVTDGTITFEQGAHLATNLSGAYILAVTPSPGGPAGSPQNLGKSSTETSQLGTANRIQLGRVLVPSGKGGSVTQGLMNIRLHGSGCSTACRIRMAVYNDNAGVPSTKRTESSNYFDLANGSTAAWYTFDFPSFNVTAGEYIWIAYYADATGTTAGTSGPYLMYCYTTCANGFPDYVNSASYAYKTWGDYGTGLPDPIGSVSCLSSCDPVAFMTYLIVTPSGTPALSLSQSATVGAFYVLEGTASLSQSSTVNFLISKGLIMNGPGTELTYQSGLANPNLTSGPGGTWVVKRGTYKYTSSP